MESVAKNSSNPDLLNPTLIWPVKKSFFIQSKSKNKTKQQYESNQKSLATVLESNQS